MTDQVSKIIKSLVPDFPDNEIELFLAICKTTTIKQNDYFISAGQIPRKFGFITKGLVRYLYINNEGKEFIKTFLAENSFISSYTAMKNRTQSHFSIQALIPTEIISIEYELWYKMTKKTKCGINF